MSDSERIDDLLGQASDPVQRAIIIVLGNINREIIANTSATNALTVGIQQTNVGINDLDVRIVKHMADEEIMLAGFKGRVQIVGWIAPILFSILSILGGYVWSTQAILINSIAERQRIGLQKVEVLDERTISLERRQKADEDMRQAPR